MLLRALVVAVLLPVLVPTGAGADSILKSVERLAAEAAAQGVQQQQAEPGSRLSAARVGFGVAAVAAGVAMMLIDPEQPTQPGPVSRDALINASINNLSGTQASVIAIRRSAGAAVLVCEPSCIGDVDQAIFESFAVGAGFGIGTAAGTIERQGWSLHQGPIQPFEERNPALKYGGAALVAAGVLVSAFWSHVPVANRLAVSPTVGGLRVNTSVGF